MPSPPAEKPAGFTLGVGVGNGAMTGGDVQPARRAAASAAAAAARATATRDQTRLVPAPGRFALQSIDSPAFARPYRRHTLAGAARRRCPCRPPAHPPRVAFDMAAAATIADIGGLDHLRGGRVSDRLPGSPFGIL